MWRRRQRRQMYNVLQVRLSRLVAIILLVRRVMTQPSDQQLMDDIMGGFGAEASPLARNKAEFAVGELNRRKDARYNVLRADIEALRNETFRAASDALAAAVANGFDPENLMNELGRIVSRPGDFREGPAAIRRWLSGQLNKSFLQKHSQVNYTVQDLDAFRVALLGWWTRQTWDTNSKWAASQADVVPA